MDRQSVVVVTATSVEAKAARRQLRGVRILEAGVALANKARHPELLEGSHALVSCGLAGGFHHHLHTGTVVIPREVLRPDGTTLTCDAGLSEALVAAARSLDIEPVTDPMVTTTHIVTREERRAWSQRGYAGVDMESGLLQGRVAAVRVILDTPLRELSEDWLNPVTAALKPWNWPQLVWLAREGPRCAQLAARVVGRALDATPSESLA